MRGRSGMTLVELLLGCAILTVVLIVFVHGMFLAMDLTAKAELRNRKGRDIEAYALIQQLWDEDLDVAEYQDNGLMASPDRLTTNEITIKFSDSADAALPVIGYIFTIYDEEGGDPNATISLFTPEVLDE